MDKSIIICQSVILVSYYNPVSCNEGSLIINLLIVAGVPYYITIGAVNEIGQGENITIIGFSAVKS